MPVQPGVAMIHGPRNPHILGFFSVDFWPTPELSVVVNFDFDRFTWTHDSGAPIRNISWRDRDFPLLNDRISIMIYE